MLRVYDPNAKDPFRTCAASQLASPPRGWPDVFKTESLKSLLSKGLKGRRCRLTSLPSEDAVLAAAKVSLDPDRSILNAERLHAELGWEIVTGFALFELAAVAGKFVAVQRWWNVHPATSSWVDLTPRDKRHSQLLLVESQHAVAINRDEEQQTERGQQAPTSNVLPMPAGVPAPVPSDSAPVGGGEEGSVPPTGSTETDKAPLPYSKIDTPALIAHTPKPKPAKWREKLSDAELAKRVLGFWRCVCEIDVISCSRLGARGYSGRVG